MNKLMNFLTATAIVFVTTFAVTSCNKEEDPQPQNPIEIPETVVDIATGSSDFSILVDALTKAGLVSTLQGDGPFTVFAPTNQAFEQLFDDLGVSGLDELSAETLTPVLLYHVVGISAKSSSLSTGYVESLSTATPDELGSNIFVEIGNEVMINGVSKVTLADLEAKNGIVHVIDRVLLPPTVVDLAIANPDFSILVQAVVKAGLVDALSAEGPFTVFAPDNDAFEQLFAELGVSGIADLSAEQLTPILLYHVVSGNVVSTEVADGQVPTLNTSASLDIMVSEMGVMINETTKVTAVDVQGTNGVIHAIDKVLLP